MRKEQLMNCKEHKPVKYEQTIRYVSGGELIEENVEYWYCEVCKEILDNPEKEEGEDEIPF
jgi:YgiT-type zinc finger domain-containing protein